MFLLPRVLIIGGTTYDHIAYLDALPNGQPTTIHQCRFQETTGSTGTGKAVALHQLGVPVHLISACGNDTWGDAIHQYLTGKQLSYRLFPDPAGTEKHFNLMDPEGKRISIFITNSSPNILLPEGYLQSQLDKYDIIVLNIIEYCRPWAAQVQACGKTVWTDLHDYDGVNPYHDPFIAAASHIHLSSDNLPGYKEVMEKFIGMGKSLVVCTHGKEGASLLSAASGWLHIPAEIVPVTDTNGAGDNFFAGFLWGWMQQLPERTCLQLGTRAASLCVQSTEIVHPGLSASQLGALTA